LPFQFKGFYLSKIHKENEVKIRNQPFMSNRTQHLSASFPSGSHLDEAEGLLLQVSVPTKGMNSTGEYFIS